MSGFIAGPGGYGRFVGDISDMEGGSRTPGEAYADELVNEPTVASYYQDYMPATRPPVVPPKNPLTLNVAELFDQDEVWVTRDKRVIRIVDMDPGHLRNTIAYVRRNVKGIAVGAAVAKSFGIPVVEDPSDGVFWAIEHMWAEAEGIADRPLVWLEQTKLMRKMVEVAGWNARVAAPIGMQ